MRITEKQIRAAAEASLTRWPAASAVLLFGSRARGDHLPSSDWDLAVVTDDPRGCPPDLPLLDLAELDPLGIDVAFISDDDIRRHRNLLGRLGCALARDARPIAGSWRPPAGLKEPEIDHAIYVAEIKNSLARFSEALRSAFHALHNSSAAGSQNALDNFVNRSANAAEHLAKAMLVRNGRQPRSVFDLSRLAEGIATEDPELAKTVRSLNGHTRVDHTRHYSNAPPASAAAVSHAALRLKRTGQLLAAELPHWRSGHLKPLMEDIRSFAVDLRDAQATPLDETGSEAAQAALALRSGRAIALRGAHALWTEWRDAQLEPPAPAVQYEDSPSP